MSTVPPVRKANTWRAAQIVLYLLAVGCSIGTLVGYKGLNAIFKLDLNTCILYGKPVLTKDSDGTATCTVGPPTGNNESTCNYVYLTVMASIVYSIIGCWFFIACTSEAKSRPDETVIQSWKLVIPSILCSFVMWLMVIVSASFISGGTNDFVSQFNDKASQLGCLHWQNKFAREDIALYSSVSQAFGWLCASVWFFAIILLMCRCCVAADFITHSELQGDGLSRTGTLLKNATPQKPSAVWYHSVPQMGSDASMTSRPKKKMWKSEASLQQRLLSKISSPLRRVGASSPEMELPLVMYNSHTDRVTLSDGDCESVTSLSDSHCESTLDAVNETALSESRDDLPLSFTIRQPLIDFSSPESERQNP